MSVAHSIRPTCLFIAFMLLSACGAEDQPPVTTPPSTNPIVVANAGPDQSVFIGTLVTLNGVRSTNANGTGLKYAWTLNKPSGSTAVLNNANIVNPTMTVDIAGTYEVTLVVSDGTLSSTPDTVLIMAAGINPPPAANAGLDKNIFVNQPIVLNGSGSSDANNDPLTFQWSIVKKPAGSTAELFDSTTVAPSFTPDTAGSYTMRLIVHDGTASSPPATVTLTASIKPPPTVDVGVASPFQRFVPLNTASVSLNGSASHTNPPANPPSDFLDYLWTVTPQGGAPAVALANERTAIASFSPPANAAGTYVATLKVTEINHPNPDNNSATQSMTLTIGPLARIDVYRESISADNLLRTCTSTSPCTSSVPVQSSTTIRLDGGGSLVQSLTYQWTLTSPSGDIIDPGFNGPTTATPSLKPATLGAYTLALKVTDAGGNTDTRSVTLDVVTGPTIDRLAVTIGSSAVNSVPPGTPAVLKATVSGTTSPTCEWSLSPQTSPQIVIVGISCKPGVDGATAEIPGISPEDNYTATLRVVDEVGSSQPRSVPFAVNTKPTPSFTTTSIPNTPNPGCLTIRLNGTATPPGGFLGNGFSWNWSIAPSVGSEFDPKVQQPTFIVKRTEGYEATLTATEIGAPSDSAANTVELPVDLLKENAGHNLYHIGITGVTTLGCVNCHKAGNHDKSVLGTAPDLNNHTDSDVNKTAIPALGWINSGSHTGRSASGGTASSAQLEQLAAFFATTGCLNQGDTTANH